MKYIFSLAQKWNKTRIHDLELERERTWTSDYVNRLVKPFFLATFKGTGTRDLIWLKVVSLDRSWLVGLTDELYKFYKCCFIFLINILKSKVVLAKPMPIANVNRIVFVNLHFCTISYYPPAFCSLEALCHPPMTFGRYPPRLIGLRLVIGRPQTYSI